MSIFNKTDILLDEDALLQASKSVSNFVDEMDSIHNRIGKMLDELHAGFQTPAGDKFVEVCKNDLLGPMKNESKVMQKISENLRIANSQYQEVFQKFADLNNLIN